MPAMVQARDRLLTRVAAFRQTDGPLDEPRLGREDTVVDLASEARCSCRDPEPLELLFGDAGKVGWWRCVQNLESRLTVLRRHEGQDCAGEWSAAQKEEALVLLELNLEASGEAERKQVRPNDLGKLGLGQEQEILLRAAHDRERRDHARLRCQEECVAGLTRSERCDIVGDHALQIIGGPGPPHAHEAARA